MNYPISLDTALTLVNGIFVMTTNKHKHSSNNLERNKLMQEIKMLSREREILYSDDELGVLSIMDKAIRVYSPILKKEYAK